MTDPFATSELSIMVDATSSCQLQCRYCYYGQKGTGSMHVDRIEAAINNFAVQYPALQRLNVHFMGGEPLLVWDKLLDLVVRIEPLCESRNLKFDWGLTTNLIGLDDEKTEELIKRRATVHCSIDGPADIHDRNRPFCGGQPSHDKVAAAIPNALRITPHDTARVTICPEDVEHIGRIADYLFSLGFLYVGLFPATGGTVHWTDNAIGLFVRNVARAMQEGPRHRGLPTVRTIINECRVGKEKTSFQYCGAGKHLWALDIEGGLYHCHHFTNDRRLRLADAANDPASLERVITDAVARPPYPRREQLPYACAQCPALSFCSGGCWADNLLVNQDGAIPDPLHCKLLTGLVEQVGDLMQIKEPPSHGATSQACGVCYTCQSGYTPCSCQYPCDTCQNCYHCEGTCEKSCQTRCQLCERCDSRCYGCEGCERCDTTCDGCYDCHHRMD